MQRFFSPFPNGRLGAGLVLLRAIASLMGIGLVVIRLSGQSPAPIDIVSGALSIVSSLAVLAGFFTAASASILAATVAWFWFPVDARILVLGVPAALMTIADAIAVALLGPGAFSIDAHLFGPREIVIPRDTHSPKASADTTGVVDKKHSLL